MKEPAHSVYYEEVEVVCACGSKVITGSTVLGPIKVEICSHCHPFWTGEKKLIDTEGQVERFVRRTAEGEKHAVAQATKKESRKKKDGARKTKSKVLSLSELLQQSR